MEPEPTPRARRRAREIVSAGRAHLLAVGLDGFAVRQVAETVGMTVGNLQYYFGSRNDLIEAVVRAEYAADLSEPSPSESDGDARAVLVETVGRLARRWANRDGSVYLAMVTLAVHDPRFADLWAEIYRDFYDRLIPLIIEVDPEVGAEDAALRARLMTSVLDGSALQIVDGPHGTDRPRLLDAVTDLVVQIAEGAAVTAGAYRTDGSNGRALGDSR